MKKLTFFLLVVLGGCSPKTVSTFITQPNRILYTSGDVSRVSTVDSIVRIKPGSLLLSSKLKLTLRNGKRAIVPKKAIWGYSDEKGNVWRCFKKTYYQVIRVSDVVEYELIEPRTVGPGMVINEPVRVYSKTLDSKIVGNRKRALRVGDESERK